MTFNEVHFNKVHFNKVHINEVHINEVHINEMLINEVVINEVHINGKIRPSSSARPNPKQGMFLGMATYSMPTYLVNDGNADQCVFHSFVICLKVGSRR